MTTDFSTDFSATSSTATNGVLYSREKNLKCLFIGLYFIVIKNNIVKVTQSLFGFLKSILLGNFTL